MGNVKMRIVTVVVGLAFFLALVAVAVWEARQPTQTPTKPTASAKAQRDVPKAKPKPEPKPKVKRTHRVNRAQQRNTYRYATRTNTASKRYAQGLVSQTQWPCLHELWMRESGWSPTSDNPTSSAYGIPQILGLEKRTGDDYKAQVRAGLDYISHRYGTPCKAMAFWSTHRWY
jgi:hypothetical protein